MKRLLLLGTVLFLIACSPTRQLSDGYYLIQFANDDEAARDMVGQSAVNAEHVKKKVKAESAIAVVSTANDDARIDTNNDLLRVKKYLGGSVSITTSMKKKSNLDANLDLSKYGVKATLDIAFISSIEVSVTSIDSVVSLEGNFDYNNEKICENSGPGGRYSGDFRIPKDRGYNYVKSLLQGDGTIRVELSQSYVGQANVIEQIKAGGGILNENVVSYEIKNGWGIAEIVSLSKEHCTQLTNQPVR